MGKFGVHGLLDKWKKGDMPWKEMVYITLDEYGMIDKDTITLTPQLANDTEVDWWIDDLIKDLEKVRKKAKEKIHKNDAKVKAAATMRSKSKKQKYPPR